MPSERRATPLVRLADVLAEAGGGARPTALELAELLWLARQMEDPAPAPSVPTVEDPVRPTPEVEEERQPEHPPVPGESAPPEEPVAPPRAPLHLPAAAPAKPTAPEPHAALLAPAPPMLHHPLALQRSLRPLKRRTAAPDRLELDGRATADRIARLGAEPEWWLPVLRPAQERWLSLNLLYDTGPTMPVWRPLIRELHTALAQSGIFRTITAHPAAPDGAVPRPAAHAPADGRTVTLLISDCMGPQWRPGPADTLWYGTLRRWAHRMPLAVVQPLPEHLWRDTALPAAPGLLSAPHPAAPNSALSFVAYDETTTRSGVPLPVLEPDPRWLANWASLVAAPGGQGFPGSVGWLGSPVDTTDRTDFGTLTAEELVLRFRASASTQAVRLAGHLALGRADLPVMRLVQAALEPRPRPQHLAEVILSGMLTKVPGPPGSYDFRPGVRELLLRSLPRTARRGTSDLLSRLGALIDDRAGVSAGEIRATTPMANGTVTETRSDPIATVAEETRDRLVRRPDRGRVLGGRYRLVEGVGEGGYLWRGEVVETGEPVVVSVFPTHSDPERVRDFLRDAEALKKRRPENVVAVRDHGVEDGQQYVVMEYVDGVALNSLVWSGTLRLPAPLLVSTLIQLARAVAGMHKAGVAHGRLDTNRVMLLPDGRVRLVLCNLGYRGQAPYAIDLRTLGDLVFRLVSSSYLISRHSLSPDQLDGLPATLRPSFVRALRLLMSNDHDEQQEGLNALQHDMFVRHAWKAHDPLYCCLLGPVSIRRGSGQPVATGSPQEQAMLAMLLLHHGRTLTHTQLTEGIWGPQAPEGDPELLLRSYASRLRNALGPGVLATTSNGYALHTSADFVDVITCQKLVEQAERQRAEGELASARTTVDEALSLWRGEVLDGVPGPAAAAARPRFQQLRLTLAATRAELDLELGEFERAAADLDALLRTHPHREDLRRLYLLALQRQGRTDKALEVFEEYEVSGGDNPELLAMGHELREALGERGPDREPQEPPLLGEDEPDRLLFEGHTNEEEIETEQRDCARFEFAGYVRDGEALAALRRLVGRLVASSGLVPDQYRLVESDQGVTVRLEPYVVGAGLLRVTLEKLADDLAVIEGLQLCVTFWQAHMRDSVEIAHDRPDSDLIRAALHAHPAQAIVVLSDFWHYAEIVGGGAADPRDFSRLSPHGGWYRWFAWVPDVRRPAVGPAVHGPFPMPYNGKVPQPVDDHRAIVLALGDGGLAFPNSPSVRQAPAAVRAGWRYFEVDLRERRFSTPDLPRVFASWRVEDPLRAAESPGLDVPGMISDMLATADHDDLQTALADWSVPGYEVLWTLPPAFRSPTMIRSGPLRRTPQELVRHARVVMIGFDEVLTQLFSRHEEREVLQDVVRTLVEVRDPADALSGQPLPSSPRTDRPDTLGLLRAFAGHKLANEAREAMDRHEIRAADRARPTPHSRTLLRVLAAHRALPTVVTDRSVSAMASYLRRNGLYRHVHTRVFGRPADLTRMMPHPYILQEALDRLRVPAAECVLVASTTAEQAAARAIGLPFIGYAPAGSRHLRAADDDVRLVSSLSPLIDAALSR
ncbi:DNA-binding transcriptional activator of the SARP family [Streptomyces sp. DI166]|uniref:SAV_2336 N-terminal domain-related protein n=1 Tax=Streptomyces sp. DI166 TaxID=1839783 RepID=UPI0007F53D65|nr:SAV_2336 N-terminal domain-related protein [Streptomyces sp. DI166]SBT88418.1 DNA-binding transcriptional activator of the SARP family [Streptomyces sp. DI166]